MPSFSRLLMPGLGPRPPRRDRKNRHPRHILRTSRSRGVAETLEGRLVAQRPSSQRLAVRAPGPSSALLLVATAWFFACDGAASRPPDSATLTDGGPGHGQCCDAQGVCFVAAADTRDAFMQGCDANAGRINGWCDGDVDPVLASQAELDCLEPQPWQR